MESSNMKNMVVIKNFPSNMVEEAIIIFKENQKVHERELVEKNNNVNFNENKSKTKEFILKEAEMIITDYINKIEEKKYIPKDNKNKMLHYKRLKIYSIIVTAILISSIIINFI